MTTRPWLNEYAPNTPTSIEMDAHQSVVEILKNRVAKTPDKGAFASFDTTKTFRQIDELSDQFAAYLQSIGVQKGDRVALMMPNLLQYPVSMFGVMKAGGVVVNVNPMYTPRELAHQLNDSDSKIIVIYNGSTGTLADIETETPLKHVITAGLGDLLDEDLPSPAVDKRLTETTPYTAALEQGSQHSLEPVALTPEDVAFLQYTGGTTGVSKGATLIHRNIVSNSAQMSAWLGNFLDEGEETFFTALPLYHIFALLVNGIYAVQLGALSVLIANPRDLPGVVESFKTRKYTFATGVNTLFNGLLHTPGFEQAPFHFKLCIGGGAAVQDNVAEKWLAITGCPIMEGYGLSETSPVACVTRPDIKRHTGNIGLPMPSTDVAVLDDAGKEMPIGERGELCIRGPQVMTGYWKRPEATAEVMTDDGYFRTGDIAIMDEKGYFKIVDRKKDMIIVSGFNVFPNEIENVVAGMDGVMESACIGVPHEKTGEAVKLFIVKTPGSDISEDDVVAYCRENLTAYKVPRLIEFLTELPKSSVGKILRRELRTDA